jgi:hypothetical protein
MAGRAAERHVRIMPVHSRILVPHPERLAIADALQVLLGAHPLFWRVTIRPSTLARHWSIEISRPGLFLACAAGPRRQTPGGIRDLVQGALQRAPVPHG